MPENAPVPLHRTERVLAAVIAATVAVSVVAIAVVLIAAGAGVGMAGGIWPSLMLVGYLGLPLAFAVLVVFLLVNAHHRRHARTGDR